MRIRWKSVDILALAATGVLAGVGVAPAQLMSADVGVNPTFKQTDATTVNSTTGAVPEPSTWTMLLLGFVGLGGTIRRRAITAGVARTAGG